MTHEVVVRFAPAYDTRHFDEDAPGPRPEIVVSRDALKPLTLNAPTPVVIDHDRNRVVGHVESTWVADDVDYGTRIRKWFFATLALNGKPPEWLKRGSGVSWSYNALHEYNPLLTRDVGTTVLASCVFREVSLLTPGTAPAEPLARVMLVREAEPAETVIHGGPLIRRLGHVLGVR